ncbi:hypothetical protein OG948_08150 [Embleya sp. NBC_00888]|uniref:hypothetical protein n=1 Tax=Embleya sp. NBC_00888 TaxID=2975960 RepID=UPI003867161C|nr:hypothetical protein OG948_08150 [Embleya sp. NBC_00888]
MSNDTTATSPDTIAVGPAQALSSGSLPVHRASGAGAATGTAAPVEAAGVYRATNHGVSVRVGRFPDIPRRNG